MEWLAQKEALCKAGKTPRPSTLHGWQSDLKSLLAYFGEYKLHTITTEAVVQLHRVHAGDPYSSRKAERGKVAQR